MFGKASLFILGLVATVGLAQDTARPRNLPRSKPILPSEKSQGELLSDQLVKAKPEERKAILEKFGKTVGTEYTEALALSIPRLTGDAREETRKTLERRLRRFSARTLSRYIKDDDPEFRAAAVRAGAAQGRKELIPHMIDRLADPVSDVRKAAHKALQTLTAQDFGPKENATRQEVEKAIADWKEWWKKNESR